MSNWTLKKIKACEEIKFGTMCKYRDMDFVFVKFSTDQVTFGIIDKFANYCCVNVISESVEFYRPDGSEILPPEDKPKERRLYAYRSTITNRLNYFFDELTYENTNHIVFPEFERTPEWDIVKSEGV